MSTASWEALYDADLSAFPVTAAVRASWGPRNVVAGPVASPEAIGEIFNAIYTLETRVKALGG